MKDFSEIYASNSLLMNNVGQIQLDFSNLAILYLFDIELL